MASLRLIVKLKAAAVRNRKLTLSTQHTKCSSIVIEDLLTIDKVRTLENIFTHFEREQKRCMDIYEFRAAMRQVLGNEHASKTIDDAFMKVDSNCDGTVSWDEYLSYIQLRYTEQDHMYYSANIRPFPGRCSKLVRRTEMSLRYADSIIQVRYQPHTVKSLNNLYEAVASDKCGRYVHISQDGCVNLFNNDMDLTKSFRVEPPSDKLGAWVLDMVILYNVRMIAVSTTYFEIRFYDIVANGFKLELTVRGFDSCATCMDYWVQEDKLSHAILVLGDLNGSIYALEFNDCPTICVLQPALPNLKRKYQHELDINDIDAGRVCGMTGYKLSNVHEKPVSMVKYIYDLRAFISCCSGDPERSVFFGDFQRRREPSIIQISRGVTCFDFCQALTVIVCGSKDAIVRVYNPYIPNKPVMTFRQHRRPIIYVFANEVKEQVISVDCEKCVHVHDLNTQVCILTVIRIWVPLPPRPITAAFFNVERQSLILCNNEVAVFEHREEELRNMQTRSTTCAITQLLYNDVFRQVVTGDVDGDVIIWDPVTGMRALQFTAYQSSTEWERKVDNSVTAMCFDETKRQLATGNTQGILRVWNFNNGALMRELTVVAHRDITCIIWIPNKILTAGWDRRIWMHLDYPEDRATVHQWERLHKDDITAMAFHAPNLLVTGSYDGEVLIWCINTREVISRINPTVSMRHQIPRSRFARSSQDTLKHTVVASTKSTVAAPVTPSRNGSSPDFEQWETDTEKQEDHISLPGIGDRPLEVRHHLRKATEKSRRHPDDRISAVIRPLTMAESTSCVKSAPRRRTLRPSRFEQLISRNKQAIENILFLVTRPTSPTVGSLVVANNFGWMRFWSFHLSGSLIGQYCAVHTVGESVCAIATDSLNRYLITGDTDGYSAFVAAVVYVYRRCCHYR
ncbi:WD repeat-containing protein on Y chromosome [Lamellibrachia satsuma]|nr:WD repeat-containing protein on Y chromosome [Lamellibrachia satsuma]